MHSGCPCIWAFLPWWFRFRFKILIRLVCTFKFPFLRKLSPDEDLWMGGGVVGPWKGSFSSQWDDLECMKQLKSILFIIWSKIVRLKAAAFFVWVVSFEVTNYYGFSYFCLPDLCMVFSLFLVTNWYNDLVQLGLSFCVWMDMRALSDWFHRFFFYCEFWCKKGLGGMWKMIIEFVHWDCYIVFLMIWYKLKTRFFLPFVV